MRHMGLNALEYKSLVKEGTKYSSRLVVSYTQGAQQIFNKVQQRRAEIQRLRSQMQAEKKATATAATGKAVVDLTEREDENGNHMNMKIMQIVDDRVNSRTANSVTIAAKKEARKVATEQVDRRVEGILKQCGITAELPVLPDGDPPSNTTYFPQQQLQPTSMITTQTTDETINKRKRGSDRQRGSRNNRNGNKNHNRNANPHHHDKNNNNRNNNNDDQEDVNNINTSPAIAYDNNFDIATDNNGNGTATHGDTEYNNNNYDDNNGNNQTYERINNTSYYNSNHNKNHSNNRNYNYNNSGGGQGNRNNGNHSTRNNNNNNTSAGNGNNNNTGTNSPNRSNYTNSNNTSRNGNNNSPTNGHNKNNT
jgi:hypothetical protein